MCTWDYVIQLPIIYERFMIGSKPIDKLKLQATKLHKDPAKCGLTLMSCLFTSQEMIIETQLAQAGLLMKQGYKMYNSLTLSGCLIFNVRCTTCR